MTSQGKLGTVVRDPERGFSIIELLIAMSVMSILVSIGMLILGSAPRRAANEAAAIASLRTVITAERVFWLTYGNGYYGDLAQLSAATLIDAPLSTGTRQGYNFAVASQGKDDFTAIATPISPRDGMRSFFADSSGIIRARIGSAGASVADPPLGQ